MKFKFLIALIVGATFRLWRLLRATGSEAQGVWRAMTFQAPRVTELLRKQRLETCRQCPIYYAKLETCGSPLAADPDKGCHCYLPIAAGVWHRCWARQEGLPYGWPKELESES